MAKKTKDSNLSIEGRLEQALIPNWNEPYKLPENWCWIKIGSINNYVGHSINPANTPFDKFELYSVPSSDGNYPEMVLGTEIGSTKQSVEKDDVLLCKINPRINRVWKVSQHTENTLIASSEWIIIRNKNIVSDYLMWCLRSPYFREFMLSNVSGVGGSLMRAQPKYVQNYPIPLPPFGEQKRIVATLEALFSKLEEAKEKAQEVVDGFETRKASILHKAFSGELTAQWRENNGISIETWKEYDLQSVCSEKITDGTHKTPIYSDAINGIPFLSSKDVTSEKIDWENIKYIDAKLHEELYARLAPQIDDVLLAKNGTTGVAALVDVEKVFDLYVTLAVLRPNKAIIDPKFLHKIVNSPICKTQFNNHLKGIGVPNLHLRDIKKVVVNVPTLPEQEEIVGILEKFIVNEQKSKEIAEAVIEQIDTMKKAILARAFRGELGTNDSTEESATELIKQIIEKKIKKEDSKQKRTPKKRVEVTFVAKTILEAVKYFEKLTPEKLKAETELEIDDFYDQLKALINSGQVRETRIDGESYLEAVL